MATSSNSPQTINVSDLDLPQLADVRRQLEEELTHLSNSFTQLKQAQAKFKACLENVAEIKPENKGKVILVPLTNSLYVPGKLCDVENVIVDVGTGYYVQKSRNDASKHYQEKVEYVRKNLETLQETIQRKQDNIQLVGQIMQAKIHQASQARAARASKS